MSGDEPEIERLLRISSALGHINHAIVRTATRDELFARVCRVLVEEGGLDGTAVVWRAAEHEALKIAAHAGGTYATTLHDRCAATIAIADNVPYVCNDVRDSALADAGCRAVAAFPIRESGITRGALAVYSQRAGFFADRELALVTEVAADMSFALDHLASEAARRTAEAEAESERRFASGLLEALPGIVYFYDISGRFLRWNRNFETVTGYTSEEIARMHPRDFFVEPERSQVEARIGDVFTVGEAHIEASIVGKDGKGTPHHLTGRRILLNGAPHLVGVGVEISERVKAEQALLVSVERYRSTLDAMLEGGQLLAFDWTYLYLNPAAEKHNRRPNTELLGKRMMDAWPGIEATPAFAMLKRAMDERVHMQGETEFVFTDGSTGWFDVRAQPVPEGIFVLSIDISERKRIEDEVRALNDTLERKVITRTVDLEAAKVRAEAADKLKSAFLATMSHELRTPLNSILGFTGIVLQRMAGPLTEAQAQHLEIVQASSRHLLDLINDVLDVSKIEAGQLELDWVPVDLRGIVEQVTASVLPQLEKKGLALDVQLPNVLPAMESDPRRVQQILLNLVNNAIKFTLRGTVTIVFESVGDDAICLRVADTGIGIKQDDLPKLFQPFRQIDSGLQRQHEGTGLGLAICARLASLLGGTIHVESTWGKGSVFTVVLPLATTKR